MTIDIIPKTIEKYMSIIVNRNIAFTDSNEFYKGALDTLASNLEDNDFKYLKSEFPDHKLKILKKKMHILMNGYIHLKNLIIYSYHLKNVLIHH